MWFWATSSMRVMWMRSGGASPPPGGRPAGCCRRAADRIRRRRPGAAAGSRGLRVGAPPADCACRARRSGNGPRTSVCHLRDDVAPVSVSRIRARVGVGGVGAVEQDRAAYRRHAGIAQAEQTGEREVGAGAVAAERKQARVDPQSALWAAIQRIAATQSSGPAGNLCSGGQAVVDARDQKVASEGEPAADAVVAVETADHSAAAVDVDQHGAGRPRPGSYRRPGPALRPRKLMVVYRPKRRPVGVPERLQSRVHLRSCLDGRQGHTLGPILRLFGQRQNCGHLRVSCGSALPSSPYGPGSHSTGALRWFLRSSGLDSAKLANGKPGARSCVWWEA
jgi:hypothetical protein